MKKIIAYSFMFCLVFVTAFNDLASAQYNANSDTNRRFMDQDDEWAQNYINNSPITRMVKATVQQQVLSSELKSKVPGISDEEIRRVSAVLNEDPILQMMMSHTRPRLIGYQTEQDINIWSRKLNTVVPIYTKQDHSGFTFYAAAMSDGFRRTNLKDVVSIATTRFPGYSGRDNTSTMPTETRVGTVYIFKF